MRRGIAIILTLLFSSLFVLPLLASPASDESTVPQCCRKNGKHHCMMHTAQESSVAPGFYAVAPKCPCYPQATVTSQVQLYKAAGAAAIFADLVRHPAISPQADANYRISYDRSRQKRGPPSSLVS